MKKILLSLSIILVYGLTYAQDIELSYQNAEITNDGTDDFYEVDVFVKADDPFKYGRGLIYLTYNTDAFGMTPNTNGDVFFEQPVGSILDIGIDAAAAAKFFSSFNAIDNTPGILAFRWNHTFAASTISENTVTATPRLLCHIRLRYADVNEDPMICFDANLTTLENAEACGPFTSANPFQGSDCTTFPAVVRTDDTYDCTGAEIPAELCAGGIATFTTNQVWMPNAPDNTMSAIIEGVYDTEMFGNIEACELTISTNGSLIVGANTYVRVQNDIINDGAFSVLHTGSLVQVNDMAVVTNNTTVTVAITTATLKPRDFMVMGNPMTADIPTGVDNPIFRVLNQVTTDFRPHPDVQAMFPGGTNFVDEDNNDMYNYAGNFNPGEAYLVWPQASLQDGNQQYNILYSGGTLNNGVVTYALDYNTTGTGTGTPAMNKNASPSGLSNPYASAISAEDFRTANDAVDELYFWEHNTTPNTTFPGANSANFNMADISTYNGTGFNPASTGSPIAATAGDVSISTGQGFGVKNNGATTGTGQNVAFTNSMRRVDNNNTLRSPENQDNIWLSIKSTAYQLSSSTLIGFNEAATPAFDPGYDSERLGVPVSLYSHLMDGTAALGIQGREAFDVNAQVSLGFSSQIAQDNAAYTISIMDIIGNNIENATAYLKDNQTGIVTNISEAPYSFTSPMGTFNNRFTLQFMDEGVLNNQDIALQNITVYPNPASDVLHINSPRAIISAVSIKDLRGRTISVEENINTNQKTINVSALKSAVYFMNITTEQGTLTRKIVKE